MSGHQTSVLPDLPFRVPVYSRGFLHLVPSLQSLLYPSSSPNASSKQLTDGPLRGPTSLAKMTATSVPNLDRLHFCPLSPRPPSPGGPPTPVVRGQQEPFPRNRPTWQTRRMILHSIHSNVKDGGPALPEHHSQTSAWAVVSQQGRALSL